MSCSSCGSPTLLGMIFCSVCGEELAEQRTTRAVPLQRTASSGTHNEQAGVRVVVAGTGRRACLEPARSIVIGRRDAARGWQPDLDLDDDGALLAGVSRKHARLICDGTSLQIEDLGSANGTFVNGRRLDPGVAERIELTDELRLGALLLHLEP